ncbi:MAG: FHA domain-containing protein [Myxococcota bacterium]|nr:FHA domain-containing protein [Myxococcota bacterium]
MAVCLTIAEQRHPSAQFTRSFLQDKIVIGRARSSDICLPDLSISTRHAEIRLRGSDYAIIDLDSLNGTYANGVKLVAHRPRKLIDGDIISVGRFDLKFTIGALSGGPEPRDASIRQARDILSAILARSGQEDRAPLLTVVHGPDKGLRYDLRSLPSRFRIGRDPTSDIQLSDRDVSKQHIEIIIEDGAVTVCDLGSRGGVFVDDEQVMEKTLEPGTPVRLGQTVIALEHPIERSLSAIFEAPEEDTSSFPFTMEHSAFSKISQSPSPAHRADNEGADPNPPSPDGAALPPIGPADPLAQEVGTPPRPLAAVYSNPAQHSNHREKTDKSDIGLIIVGTIIIIAAVLGLMYFLGSQP